MMNSLEVTCMPFDFPGGGKVYRGKMPRGKLDNLEEYKLLHKITHIFLLQEESEWSSLKTNLPELYRSKGYTVEHYPIADMSTPAKDTMKELTSKIHAVVNKGQNALVHCRSGTGRTSLVMTCLAMDVLGMEPNKAVEMVDSAIPHTQRMRSQNQFIEDYRKATPEEVEKASLQADPLPKPLDLTVTHIPFDLGGKIYRGKMPRKEQLDLLGQYKKLHEISSIFLLQTNEELNSSLGCDLAALYRENGYDVEQYPIVDGYTIPQGTMKELVGKIISAASQGSNCLVHCYGGTGRTTMVLACLAMEALSIGGRQAMDFIKAFVPRSEFVKNTFQKKFILSYSG